MTSYVGFLWQHTTNDHQHDFHWSHQTESRCFATMSGDFWFAPAVMSKKELANDWLPQLQNVLDWQGLKFIWILFPSINVKTGCHCHGSFKWHPILSPSFVKLLCHCSHHAPATHSWSQQLWKMRQSCQPDNDWQCLQCNWKVSIVTLRICYHFWWVTTMFQGAFNRMLAKIQQSLSQEQSANKMTLLMWPSHHVNEVCHLSQRMLLERFV